MQEKVLKMRNEWGLREGNWDELVNYNRADTVTEIVKIDFLLPPCLESRD